MKYLKFIIPQWQFFKSLLSGALECLPGSLTACDMVRVPSGVMDSTQWGTIEGTQPPPPRHTLCVPLALLERFSYANESCIRQIPPSPPPFPLFPFPPQKQPQVSSAFALTFLSWRGLWAQAEQLGETSLCSVFYGRRDQTSMLGSLSCRDRGKEAFSPSPLLYRWLH